MELISLMLSRKIGSLEEDEWEAVLIGTHDNIDIKKTGQGMLILTNNAIVKCVSNYYRNPSTELGQKIKTSNLALRCFYVQGVFGIAGINTFQCDRCHLHCLNLRKIHALVRNYDVK